MSSEDFKIQILIQRGRFEEAEALICSRLAGEPNDPDLHLMLAQTLFELDRPKEAEISARTAIGLDPGSGYPHEVLAQILLGSSDTKGAEEAVRQANALDGDCASRRAILARVAAEQGKFQQCLEHAQAGLEMEPDDDTCRFFRGIALGKLGRHEEADQETLGLLRDDPDDPSNHSARGWILLDRNATEDAKMHFYEALRLDPENEDARSGLARCMQQGNPVLGWLLRAIIALDRIPFYKVVVFAVLAGIVVPRFLKGENLPLAVTISGQVLRTGVMGFLYLVVVVEPLFNTLLFVTREGRNALGPYELKAVKWSILPLFAGLVHLAMWMAGGGKWIPVAAIGLLCAATLLYEGISLRHPWVRRRMLIVAGLACGSVLWFMLGPAWLLNPMVVELVQHLSDLAKNPDPEKLRVDIRLQVSELLRIKNQAFAYPALALYLLTAYSENLIAALTRKAPDDAD